MFFGLEVGKSPLVMNLVWVCEKEGPAQTCMSNGANGVGLVFVFLGESLKAPTTVLIYGYTQIYTPSIPILYATLKW